MKLWEEYLNLDEKIHPKTKTAASTFAATPMSDVAYASVGAAAAYKAGKIAGDSGGKIALSMAKHSGKGALISMGIYAAYRMIKAALDKCNKQCGEISINNTSRQLCMLKCKRVTLQKQLVALK